MKTARAGTLLARMGKLQITLPPVSKHLATLLATSASFSVVMGQALAQSADNRSGFLTNLQFDPASLSTDTALFAVFTGAFSFSMLAATWLIRERRRLARGHHTLQLENADLRSRNERRKPCWMFPISEW